MISLERHADGLVLPVRAQPGARRNVVKGVLDGALKVSVTQPAEKGKANRAIVELLSRELRIKKSQLALISGETSAQKRFLIRAASLRDVQERLNAILETSVDP